MTTFNKIVITFLCSVLSVIVHAQSLHWYVNAYNYQYDMAVCFSLIYNDEAVADIENYEVAAFCGDECRGIGEFQFITLADEETAIYGYIRIRSNNKEDETIIFKVYDKTLNLERNVTETVSFINQELIGMPSNPIQLNFYEDRPVVITVNDYQRTYGDENPIFEFTVEGVDLIGVPEVSCDANHSSSVGDYPITISKGSLKNTNVTFVNGILTVTKVPLTISVGSYTKKQYDPMPEFSVTYEGFKNNETEAVLITQPVLSCEADEDSAPGEYNIVVSDAEAENYEIQYVLGKLIVTDPPSYTITYMVDGEVYQNFTIKYRDSITPLEAPTKEGYTFSGWSEIPETMPANDVIVTGTFTVNSYIVRFMYRDEVLYTEEVNYGEPIPLPELYDDYGLLIKWLDVPETMPAHDIVILVDETDAVLNIQGENKDDIKIYDINGHRLASPQKGINIIRMSGGTSRKVLIK